MPQLHVGDVCQMTINGELFGQRIMSTFHYAVTAITGAPDDSVVFSELNIAMSNAGKIQKKFLACCPAAYTALNVWYQVIKPIRYAIRRRPWLAGADTSTFEARTANVAQVITRRGALGRRSNVSNLHIPSPTHESWISAGLLTTDALIVLNALALEMQQNYSTTTGATLFAPVINNAGNATTDVTNIVDTFPNELVRVMRRRTVGLGI